MILALEAGVVMNMHTIKKYGKKPTLIIESAPFILRRNKRNNFATLLCPVPIRKSTVEELCNGKKEGKYIFYMAFCPPE